ncbi:MAG: sugar isomerase domain-containing protein [Erysipelotrichaceae bacterium]|nr:sugar isomerase domain-containing protein [Erysipelotrichaceae bacterium]MDD3924044.1 sugar isomerase domain-containing protein [Erysipelotrichaceae bacterium]MDD4643075.1 sugar isomerase domain-containing protein [Erysipelotrichaceae bacterium]
MATYHDLFRVGKQYLQKVADTQQGVIKEAAKMMGNCMLDDGLIQLFGLEHNHAFTMELFYRAGGLMPYHGFNVRDLVLRSKVSIDEFNDPNFLNRSDIIDVMWEMYNVNDKDMFILTSDLGNEGCVIDMAIKVKEKGHKLIVVTSIEAAKKAESKHLSGKKLYEFADLIIDNQVNVPDLAIKLDDKTMINQMATLTGNTIAQMLTAEIYRYLVDKGHEAPVLLSANVKGADVHNKEISDKYLGRWNA